MLIVPKNLLKSLSLKIIAMQSWIKIIIYCFFITVLIDNNILFLYYNIDKKRNLAKWVWFSFWTFRTKMIYNMTADRYTITFLDFHQWGNSFMSYPSSCRTSISCDFWSGDILANTVPLTHICYRINAKCVRILKLWSHWKEIYITLIKKI